MSRWGEFRLGWIFAIFDLPVKEASERRLATNFRADLLDEGFIMLQYSVYARPCVHQEAVAKYTIRVKQLAPQSGKVRIFFLTDNQWRRAVTIESPDYRPSFEEPEMPDQMTFW